MINSADSSHACRRALLLVVFSALSCQVRAQSHFVECPSLTGNDATMIIRADIEPKLDGEPLAEGDEIAAFTPRGTCAGVGVWEGTNLAFAVWGDDSISENATEGFSTGEEIHIRIWDSSGRKEYGAGPGEIAAAFSPNPPYTGAGEYESNGIYLLSSLSVTSNGAVDVPDSPGIPSEYSLAPNYPNPFNPSTTLSYDLAEGGATTLVVYDMLGRQVQVLVNEHQEAGRYEIRFEATGLPSGSYMYRLASGDFIGQGTMVLTK